MKTSSAQTEEIVVVDRIVQHRSVDFASEQTTQTVEDAPKKVEFKKYPCFYCDTNIAHDYHLNEHRRKCRGTPRMFGVSGLPQMPVKFPQNFPPVPSSLWF